MKKFFCVMILCVCAFVFAGCQSAYSRAFEKSISEIQNNLFMAEDDEFKVTFASGKRENPFSVDGRASELVSYGVLTAFRMGSSLKLHESTFKLTVGEKEFAGKFEVNPFDQSFVFDIGQECDDNDLISVKIVADNKQFEYVLVNALSDSDARAEEICKIAQSEMKDKLGSLNKVNGVRAEIYIRLIASSGRALWYVSAVFEDGQVVAIVVSPTTKEVLAKKD